MNPTSLRNRRFLILLVTLLAVLVVQSFARGRVGASVQTDLLVTLAVLTVLFSVFEARGERVALLAVAIAAITGSWG